MRADPILYALTGQDAPAGGGTILHRLAALGWSVGDVRRFRDERVASGKAWPLPIDKDDWPAGFAAFAAALDEARRELELDGDHRPPAPKRHLDADERRLIADRPPHW